MNKDDALDFLRQHQPMPPDQQLTEEEWQTYKDVRAYFIEHPDPQCIPLFLNSFGEGDGCGLYVVVDEVLWKYSTEEVVPHLLQGLHSPHRSVRYWCAEIASKFPDPRLVEALEELLSDQEDSDFRSAAAIALAFINDDRVDHLLQQALLRETDSDVRELLEDIISHRPQTREWQRPSLGT